MLTESCSGRSTRENWNRFHNTQTRPRRLNTQERKKTSLFEGKLKIFPRAQSIRLGGVPLHFLFSPTGTKHWVGLTTTLQFRAKIGADESRAEISHSKSQQYIRKIYKLTRKQTKNGQIWLGPLPIGGKAKRIFSFLFFGRKDKRWMLIGWTNSQ